MTDKIPIPAHDSSLIDTWFARYRAERDPADLERVFAAVRPRLERIARRFAPEPSLAEDLVQNTLLAAIRAVDAFEPGRRVVPWLVGILHNRALRARRSSERSLDPLRLAGPAPMPDPAASASARDLERRVAAAIGAAPAPSRIVLELYVRHGLQPAEIARWLRRSPSTVRTQLQRGLQALRRQLGATA
jgi:RNA polymerase sigma-70 factor (ECF subfamily)